MALLCLVGLATLSFLFFTEFDLFSSSIAILPNVHTFSWQPIPLKATRSYDIKNAVSKTTWSLSAVSMKLQSQTSWYNEFLNRKKIPEKYLQNNINNNCFCKQSILSKKKYCRFIKVSIKHVYLPDRVLGTLHRYKKYRLYQNTLSETYTDHIKIKKKHKSSSFY